MNENKSKVRKAQTRGVAGRRMNVALNSKLLEEEVILNISNIWDPKLL